MALIKEQAACKVVNAFGQPVLPKEGENGENKVKFLGTFGNCFLVFC